MHLTWHEIQPTTNRHPTFQAKAYTIPAQIYTLDQGSRINPSAKKGKPIPKKTNAKPPKNRQRKAPSKKSDLEAIYKDEVKAMFMDWFKKNKAAAGHVMGKQDVIRDILRRLDAKQDKALEKAMDELNREGLIETKEDGVTLVLTQKGADLI
jgi:hypothetical protein